MTVTGLPLMYSMWNLPCFFSAPASSSLQPSGAAWANAGIALAATRARAAMAFMAIFMMRHLEVIGYGVGAVAVLDLAALARRFCSRVIALSMSLLRSSNSYRSKPGMFLY